MKKSATLLCILYFTCSTFCTSRMQASEDFNLKGVCKLGGEWFASIHSIKDGGAFWLKSGQCHGELTFNSYNPTSSTANLSFRGVGFELKIAKQDDKAISVINPKTHTKESLADINHKVEEYRQGLSQLLATPDAGPRSPEDQKKLEQDLKNAVANYRQRLMTTANDNPSAPTDMSNKTPRRRIVVRRHNRVNSRIWASDHIEKYGEPDENGKLVIEAPISD